MANEVFDALFREQVDVFRAAFSAVATEVFYDASLKRLRHSGEYGLYRETIVRDFLRFIVPSRYDISTGFVMTTKGDISTQCDIIVFDPAMTPLFRGGDRQRFFPIESVICIGEVKSRLSRTEFAQALNKLAAIKSLGERIEHPAIPGRHLTTPFDPVEHPYDLVPSFLICQKLDFSLDNIENEIAGLYDPAVPHRHKHNLVFSIEDGLLTYEDTTTNTTIPYNRLRMTDLKHRFASSGADGYMHFRLFGSFVFMLSANKTILFPEFTDYVLPIRGIAGRTEV